MTQGFEQIGVKAIFDATQFMRGFQQYVAAVGDANKAGDEFAKRIQQAGKVSVKAFKDFQKGSNDALKAAEKNTKSYIRTAIDLQAAFNGLTRTAQSAGAALRDAAAGRDVRRSFELLSQSAKVNADKLLASMQGAARGTVEEVELMRIANRALLAGGEMFAERLPQLFQIARAAALATNQDVLFVFDTLTRGVAKASPLLIDNAEVYIKIGSAVDDYAEKLGITADELNLNQRRLAILNAVTEQGLGLVQQLGENTEFATDKFDQFRTKVNESKRDFQEFILDSFGSETGAKIYAIGEAVGSLSDELLALTLIAKGTGLSALFSGLAGSIAGGIGGAISGGLGSLAAGAASIVASPIVGGVGLGIAAYEGLIRKLNPELLSTGDILDKGTTILQYWGREVIQGKEAADEWFRAVTGMETAADRAREALELFNAELADQETQTERAALDLGQQVVDWLPPIPFVKERMQQIVDETASGVDQIEEEFRQARVAEALGEAMARVDDELREDIQDLLESINDQLSERADARIDFYTDSLTLERDYQDKMAEIARDGADKRRDIEEDYAKAVREAQQDYQQAVEDANRQHARRLEDIEQQYQRRVQEIQRDYQLTVQEAAAERDALAIYRAEQTRSEQLRDAEQTRSDQLRAEAQNYQDRLRAAEQALREQTEAAREQYQQRIRELDQTIAEEERKEKNSYARRLADLRKYYNDVIAETSAFISRYQEQLNRLQGQGYKIPGLPRTPNPPAVPQQHGMNAVVTGPQHYYVEPGITEHVYFSGDLNRRESVAPSNAGVQAQMMRATVSGAIGANLSGFNQGLLDRIGPSLTNMIVQGALDEIGEAFQRAF